MPTTTRFALHAFKLPQGKRSFVLLPRGWVVEPSFAWMPHFTQLANDFERLPKTVEGLIFEAFALMMVVRHFAESESHYLADGQSWLFEEANGRCTGHG